MPGKYLAIIALLATFLDYTLATNCTNANIGQRLPVPNSCSKFQICLLNLLTVRECPKGLHFNRDLEVCDLPARAGCVALEDLQALINDGCEACDCNVCCTTTGTTPTWTTPITGTTPTWTTGTTTPYSTWSPTPSDGTTKATTTGTTTPYSTWSSTPSDGTTKATTTGTTTPYSTWSSTPSDGTTKATTTGTTTPYSTWSSTPSDGTTKATTTGTTTPYSTTAFPTTSSRPTGQPDNAETTTCTSVTMDSTTKSSSQTTTNTSSSQTKTPTTGTTTPYTSTAGSSVPPPSTEGDCDAPCCGQMNGKPILGETCQQFIICNGGRASVFGCPNNLHFNAATGSCDFPENAKCSKPYTPPTGPHAGPSGTHCANNGRCIGQPDGTQFPNAQNPCSNTYVVCQCECEVERSCGASLMFNSQVGVCDWPSNFQC
uniref:Chitin-binding type-2 domain-containing protein n=1 Tax=Stomoxys calcitrans TaxID=35570 RepID=A0A1I8PPM8_STOCA